MEHTSEVVCPTCTAAVSVRVTRNGFLQQNVLSRFGVYPWKCGACGSTFLSRHRGQKMRPSWQESDPGGVQQSQRRA